MEDLRFKADYITICLEFFGSDIAEAVPAVVEVKQLLDDDKEVLLTGLEHLDERYIKAVKYTTKASTSDGSFAGRPKMVLLADIASDDEAMVKAAAERVIETSKKRNAQGFRHLI